MATEFDAKQTGEPGMARAGPEGLAMPPNARSPEMGLEVVAKDRAVRQAANEAAYAAAGNAVQGDLFGQGIAPAGPAVRPRPPAPPPARGTAADEDSLHASDIVKYSPPWLVSAAFHALLILVLGLWVISGDVGQRLALIANLSDREGEQLEHNVDLSQGDPNAKDDIFLLPNELPEVDDPLAAPPSLDAMPDPLTSSSSIDTSAIGLALTGREEGMKQALLAAWGGTGATEKAVVEGLKWLARQQRRDGSWSLTGPYSQGGFDENVVAATAMALLAFQGAGHTHLESNSSPFQKVVRRGLNVLLKEQDKEGNFFHRGASFHRLYTQAQCTIVLCELYAMTQDKKLKEPAQRAVDYCLRVQDDAGGWRYFPGTDSDLSVTGWFTMALQSARMAYLAVPDANMKRISRFLDSVAISGGSQYLYRPASHGGLAMTAEGLLCRQYLGWQHNDPRLRAGVQVLTDNLMDWNDRNVYYWYYATQVCHHMGGESWQQWNRVMRDLLPEKQTLEGRERGSWAANGDRWGSQGGRLFVTCLSIYNLEVYYRHLSVYQREATSR